MSLRKLAPLRLVAKWYSNLHQGYPCGGLLSHLSTKGLYIRCGFVIPQPSSPLDLIFLTVFDIKCESKAILVQAWTKPEESSSLRFPDFKTVGTGMW
jgi:hypothetical protein